MPDYTAAHARAGIDAKLPTLETWPNHFPGYDITIKFPEYPSRCRKTGSGLRHYHDSIPAGQTLPRIEIAKDARLGLPCSGYLLGKCCQPDAPRHFSGDQADVVPRHGRFHCSRRSHRFCRSPLVACECRQVARLNLDFSLRLGHNLSNAALAALREVR